MVKTLRSLIQEKFPMELRVKIELLSKRRDITNKEKQDELFKLLREYEIENIVPLGPGTNRYAFKLNGFVIKVATDHDGKIDNLKEFKMAKRLYPYVTKTYEVSENGTLLVAEYIQPFSSYGEMLNYADKIREILTKLSSVYLIGDVGITSKNFANWGLRIGGTEPVCLDFAYVYEVSSELFICKHCKSGSMLVPNKDFTELVCPQPGCGKKYLFEDIRSKIGNDIHRHEIGDLTEEGYLLSESNVVTELSTGRSNYLVRKMKPSSKKPIQEKKEEIVLDNFVMEHEPSYYNGINDNSKYFKEDVKMANMDLLREAAADVAKRSSDGSLVIRAKATLVNKKSKKEQRHDVKETPQTEETTAEQPVEETFDEGESTLAFSASMSEPERSMASAEEVKAQSEEKPIMETVMKQEVLSEAVVIHATATVPANKVFKVTEEKLEPVQPVKEAEKPIESEQEKLEESVEESLFSKDFKDHIDKIFSIVSNKVGTDLHIRAVFDNVKGNIRTKKMFPEQFYKGVQNAVFRSLMAFCNFEEKNIPNDNNKGYHKSFTPPSELEDMTYTPTMIFMSRVWADKSLYNMENPEDMMRAYRNKFSDYDGFQPEWINIFKNRLKGKIQIDESGLCKVADAVSEVWVMKFTKNNNDESKELQESTEEVTVQTEETTAEQPVEETFDEGESTTPADTTVSALPDLSGSYSMDGDNEEASEFDEDGNYTGEETDTKFLSVEIYPDDDVDVIKVRSSEAFGDVSIPFYTKLSDIDLSKNVPSVADDRNGIWDWLIHMVPDIMFYTQNPERYLEINEYDIEEDQTHVVILDENEGTYIMGIYFIEGIWIVDDNGDGHQVTDKDLLARLNELIKEDIGYSRMSHLERSLTMKELIRTEESILENMVQEVSDEMESTEEVTVQTEETTAEQPVEETFDEGVERKREAEVGSLEEAAIAALTGQDREDDNGENKEIDRYESYVNNDPKLAKLTEERVQTFAPIRRNKQRDRER